MRRTLAVALLIFVAACTPKPPPKPPEPPPPDPNVTPEKGTPVAPEILLRPAPGATVTSNGKQFNAFMALPCCNTFTIGGVEKNSRWPLASEDWMDYTHQFGANLWHFRLGPFKGTPEVEVEWADIGGPYMTGTTDFNPAFWQKVRDLTWKAHRLEGFVEVAVLDTWGCKCDQNGCVDGGYSGMPLSAIDACGRRPDPFLERHIRKAVEELGCFGNVIWSTDVEGNNIAAAQPSFYLWVRNVLRDEEPKSGCGFVHMIGTNSRMAEVESQVDYVQTHERTTLSSPIAGRWTINNERNPEFPVQTEVSNFKVARDLGLAWAAWRAGMDEPTYQQVLEGMKAVTGGAGPEPPAPGCTAPVPDDPAWTTEGVDPNRAMLMGSQVSAAKDAVGDRCGRDIQQSLALVAGKLREAGYCASGPWVDAVAVLAPDGLWEEHHVVAYSTGCWTLTQNGYKGAWRYPGSGPPPPPVAGCTEPLPPKVTRFAGPNQHNNWYDTTALIRSCEYCAAIGMGEMNGTVRCECPTRSDCPGFKCDERRACEAVASLGNPLWHCESGQAEVKADNPFMARCGGGAWIEVCAADGTQCSRAPM